MKKMNNQHSSGGSFAYFLGIIGASVYYVSMGGGYSKRLADIVDAHCNTFREAFRLYES